MRRILSVFITILVLLSMCSCGAKYTSYDMEADNAIEPEAEALDGNYKFDTKATFSKSEHIENSQTEDVESDLSKRKIIKDVLMEIQTKNYDTFIESLTSQIESTGGFIQNSQKYDYSYNNKYNQGRRARITARIPADRLNIFTESISGNCAVTYYDENLKDVTLSYVDIESRISSYKEEMNALTELLKTADNLDNIIAIQSRLSEVRYELESYESQKRVYDDLISYSTVTMNISEVEREVIVEKQSTWSEIANRFTANLSDIGEGARVFFVWFVSSVPYLILIAVLIAVILVVVLSTRKKKKKNSEPEQNEK